MPGRFANILKEQFGDIQIKEDRAASKRDEEVETHSLIEAVLHGTAADVDQCLLYGEDADEVSDEGVPVLHLAAARGQDAMVMLLVRMGACVSARSPAHGNRTALHVAAMLNQESIALYLVLSGAEVDAVDELGMTPLHVAAQHNYKTLATYLIRKGANPKLRDGRGLTPAGYISASSHLPLYDDNVNNVCVSSHKLEELFEQHSGGNGYITRDAFIDKFCPKDSMGSPPCLPSTQHEELSLGQFCIEMLRQART